MSGAGLTPRSGLSLDHVLGGVVAVALEELERTGKPAAGELRERLRLLLEDQALIAARAMAGQNVEVAQQALTARFKALEAAGIVLSVGQAQRAIQGAILGALRAAFTALA